MDNLSREQRRKNMQAVKSTGTKIEQRLAKALFAKGFRYRKNDKSVAGKPDISFKKYKIAVFVDGEFWHGKDWETREKYPASNEDYWQTKIKNNIERDKKITLELQRQGWNVLRFWGKEVEKDLIGCILKIDEAVKDAKMDLKGKISLENADGKTFRVKIVEQDDSREAVLTQKMLLAAYPESGDETGGIAAEEAAQYGMSGGAEIPFPPVRNPKFRFIDLFAGVGGFRLAMQNLGGKCVFTSEWDKNAQKTYRANFGEIPFGDITQADIKSYIPDSFDLLCGGFPCQAFSIAGYRKGFADTRGTLFFDIEQILEKHRPKAVFLENVKNLVSHDKGKTFKVILDVLENKLGYKIFYKVLNSMDYADIPQNRERIFIVGFDPEQLENCGEFQFPAPAELTKSIHDILAAGKQADLYYYSREHAYYPELEKIMTKKDTVYQWRRIYVRENKSNVCPTLTANMGAGGHNVPLIRDDFGIRKLTPRECFSFQGYPENYVLPALANSRLYMQAGNSVTMPLIQRIGEEIVKILCSG